MRELVVLLLVGGCGGTNPTEKFIGTWAAETGSTQTSVCNGGTAEVVPVTANVTMTAGVGYDLLISNEDPTTLITCNINYNVSGDAATVVPGQTCPITESDDTMTTLVYTQDIYTTSDGTNMTEVFAGTYESGACTISQNNTLTKIGT